jgi:hypothetical protein
MSFARVESPAAERSVRTVMATLAQHRRQEAVLATSLRPWHGRLRALTASTGSNQIRRQATLLRIMSIVEAFVADQLVQRFEPHVPPPRPAILEDVYVRTEDGAIGTWPKMIEHYGRWFDIKLSRGNCPSWRRVEAMTNARNAIAHGLGELTRRMARKGTRELELDFATLGLTLSGNSVLISEDSLRRAAETAREFINWLDLELGLYDAKASVASP